MIALKFLVILLQSVALLGSPSRGSTDISWRVVGGANARENAFPYIGSLRSWGSHNCGCSLIRSNWLITAAHCVSSTITASYSAVLGTTKLNDTVDSVTTPVEQIFIHPEYNRAQIINDIALIKLPQSLTLSEKLQTIELNDREFDDRRDCILAGWGRTSFPGTIPNDLQYLPLQTVSYEQCKNTWAGTQPVFESQICTLTVRGEGACHGDSGGPLIIETDGVPTLIGLVSWGRPCAQGYPDVYTRVSSFISWVEDTIRQNS